MAATIATRFRVVMTAFLVWALFVPASKLMSIGDLYTLIGALTFTTGTMVLHAYMPALKHAAFTHHENLDYVDFLTLGIMCLWFALTMRIGLLTIYRQSYGSENISYALAFLQYVVFTGGLLHLSARQVIRNKVPKSSLWRVVVAVLSGLALGVTMIFFF